MAAVNVRKGEGAAQSLSMLVSHAGNRPCFAADLKLIKSSGCCVCDRRPLRRPPPCLCAGVGPEEPPLSADHHRGTVGGGCGVRSVGLIVMACSESSWELGCQLTCDLHACQADGPCGRVGAFCVHVFVVVEALECLTVRSSTNNQIMHPKHSRMSNPQPYAHTYTNLHLRSLPPSPTFTHSHSHFHFHSHSHSHPLTLTHFPSH